MISFIVIGRNEGWRLEKCLKSINNLILFNALVSKEIIYIDSDSDDNSIQLALKNKVDKVFRLIGNYNSAIARNIGARKATGDVYFFIDGDIEVKSFDIKVIMNSEGKLLFPLIVGFLDDINYKWDGTFINQTSRTHSGIIKDRRVSTVGGGIFIIDKETWETFGGMDESLKRTQDRDLSLRMAKKGLYGIRKSEVFGLHHTIPYNDKKRMWKFILDGAYAYKGVIIRRHILNPAYLRIFFREEWTMIFLVFTILLYVLSPFSLIIYIIAVILKSRKQLIKMNFMIIPHRILTDIIVMSSILIFFPRCRPYKVCKVR